RLRISSQSRHSARTVLTKRSAIAFAFGARTGVFTIRIPPLRKTSSKGPLYLLSRSRIRKRTSWSTNSRPRLRACCVTQAPVGFVVQPGEPDAPAAVGDEEQRVVAAQEYTLDREEVAGDDACCLGVQELAPART